MAFWRRLKSSGFVRKPASFKQSLEKKRTIPKWPEKNIIPASGALHWTYHAQAKMRHYGLSEARVRRVLHAPKRVEEGVAPKTVAMMQPTSTRRVEVVPSEAQRSRGTPSHSVKLEKRSAFTKVLASPKLSAERGSAGREETWTQEIWVMIQDKGGKRKVISAWRYPGKTKPRSEAALRLMKQAYNEYLGK